MYVQSRILHPWFNLRPVSTGVFQHTYKPTHAQRVVFEYGINITIEFLGNYSSLLASVSSFLSIMFDEVWKYTSMNEVTWNFSDNCFLRLKDTSL